MTDVAMPEAPAYDVDVRGANIARNKAVFLGLGLTPDDVLAIAKQERTEVSSEFPRHAPPRHSVCCGVCGTAQLGTDH